MNNLVETRSEPPETIPNLTLEEAMHPKLKLIMSLFSLSLRDVCDSSGRAISRSQLHRILRGQKATPFEKKAISVGISECLKARCDSAFLFDELPSRGETNGQGQA